MLYSVSLFCLKFMNCADYTWHIQKIYGSHPAKYRLIAVDNATRCVVGKTRACYFENVLNNKYYKIYGKVE